MAEKKSENAKEAAKKTAKKPNVFKRLAKYLGCGHKICCNLIFITRIGMNNIPSCF